MGGEVNNNSLLNEDDENRVPNQEPQSKTSNDPATNNRPRSRKRPVFTVNNIKIGGFYDILDSKNRWCEGEVKINNQTLVNINNN
jgi:hypothetical protein